MALIGPYARALGIRAEAAGGGAGEAACLLLPFADALVGRPGFLHGGVIAALLEAAARAALADALAGQAVRAGPVSLTVDFLRGGKPVDTRARGRIVRLGRRVANLEATAWQDDPARPIGAARMNLVLDRG